MEKILLIEDNEDFRINTQEIIELSNYEVITAENGVVGVEKAILEKPDLIICDVMMPQLDGYGVINILSKNPDTSGIPFIFLTAKAKSADVRVGMNLGADDYLLKPFDEETLINSIKIRIERNKRIKNQILKGLKLDSNKISTSGENAISNLISNRKEKIFFAKDEVFREGDYSNYLYFIVSGKVKCFKSDSHGKNFVTDIYQDNQLFGYSAILEDREHSDTAVAMVESKIAIIPKQDFTDLIASNREVANKFISLLAGNVREKEERLLQLAYSPVRERITTTLLQLAENGVAHEDGTIELEISRDDLANIVGTAKESLVRMLSDLKSEGTIGLKPRGILIPDLSKLKKELLFKKLT